MLKLARVCARVRGFAGEPSAGGGVGGDGKGALWCNDGRETDEVEKVVKMGGNPGEKNRS